MNAFAWMLAMTAGAGACIPAGALLALDMRRRVGWLEAEFRHFVIAFGGGVLFAAVSLVLLPKGLEFVRDPVWAVASFVTGGLLVFALELGLGLRRRESPQFAATLLDYIPESLALGGMFAAGADNAPLLALLIGLQNLPEGFNSYRERIAVGGTTRRSVLLQMSLPVPLGPVFAALGWFYLASMPRTLGAIMLGASGGILYLIFQDIAPLSKLRKHWFPPLGAVFGFSVALLGQQMLGV